MKTQLNNQMNTEATAARNTQVSSPANGGTTMKNLTSKSLSIVAFTALALLFGACSQPTDLAPTSQPTVAINTTPDLNAATDVIADSSADTVASSEDLKEVTTPDLNTGTDAGSSLQAQGGDKVPPVLTYSYGYSSSSYAVVYLSFSEKMNHDSVCKKAIKMVVVPTSGPAFNAKGTCYWYDYGSYEAVYWVSNKTFSSSSLINWKITRDAKDKAGNKLFAGNNGTFYI